MRFKLDENLPGEVASLLTVAGHDVHTVWQEGLSGSSDSDIASVCHEEDRILITLDTDFCNILNYPPERYSGIVVLRVFDQSKPAVMRIISQLLIPSLRQEIRRKLWIVQKDGIRVR
jgi:predicted nuclease of predicted toxin-antitoxin system